GLSLMAFAAWFLPDDGITKTAAQIAAGTAVPDDTVSAYYARLQWDF
ncbi:MAG: hypothetical protein HZB79_07220, partial [Deltaproteobacteria bacterium]|nr:hypothetical protein [Deltaproteobacteria bacterium]